MSKNFLEVSIAGSSGEGSIAAGDILAISSARFGLNVTTNKIYPPEIRGTGTSIFQVCVSSEKASFKDEKSDVFFALNDIVLEDHCEDVKTGGYLFYDDTEKGNSFCAEIPNNIKKIAVPYTNITKDLNSPKSKNIVALGVYAALIGDEAYTERLKSDIYTKFKNKNEKIIKANISAFEKGLEHAKTVLKKDDLNFINFIQHEDGKLVMTGNEAIAYASLVGGCKFYGGYPITPATDIMEWMAAEMPKLGGSIIQAEDEIAAIVMSIGASYAGLKSMTATSGPGLSLMSEAIGLASMAEVPLVIIDVQRGGPSTGLPTKPEQSDLNQAVYGTHGDTPKIVLAPIDVEDCFYQTILAFNLSEKYQLPVIVLSDASLGQRRESVDPIDISKIKVIKRDKYAQIDKSVPYLRYGITPNGVNSMAIPGTCGGEYIATGLEHNEFGSPNYDPKVHTAMTKKRFRKLESAKLDFEQKRIFGDPDAKIGVITWGSSSIPVLEGVKLARKNGYKVEIMYPNVVYPLPETWVDNFIKNKDMIIFAERNYVGQFRNLVTSKFNKYVDTVSMNKYSGENFTPVEVFNQIKEIIEGDYDEKEA